MFRQLLHVPKALSNDFLECVDIGVSKIQHKGEYSMQKHQRQHGTIALKVRRTKQRTIFGVSRCEYELFKLDLSVVTP